MRETDALLLFVEIGDQVAETAAESLIEEGSWVDIDKRWRARADKPHVDGQQPHVHVYLNRKQAYIVNKDGSPSHGYDNSRMPSWVRSELKNRGLVESSLIESASLHARDIFPTRQVILAALEKVAFRDRMCRVVASLGQRKY